MSIIKADFGAEKRTAARRLRTLLSLNALHEANVRGNPVPYLERASERIYQLEKVLFEAAAASRSCADVADGEGRRDAEPVTIEKAEYLQLLACRDIVEAALKQLASEDADAEF
ncbi:hypothetical protein [Roseixanthobacter glucoisosaccharinicivorans]|uniref:hypothetical protein n=1 Tax=Roseixanthobacter glucoisosaccharinicivorans TaxID=3119923 RepID=UPI0037298783